MSAEEKKTKLEFRDLAADEIEIRIGMAREDGVTLLLYKDARVDMTILDEEVGAENWQREHYECKGNLFCRVGIKFPDGWVWKADCGAESNTEKEKGEASDSFKRACVNWGIGRELYTSPFIWINDKNCTIKKDQRGNYKCYDKFKVEKIRIEDKHITGLSIINTKTSKRVFVHHED